MHLRVSDGIYFEVGGTFANVGVIRNGRPSVTYARVGGHETYVSSLDVRVIGIAGGSLVRADVDGAIGAGPRSAHIAGLPYAAFADAGAMIDPRVEPFEPKPGDGGDYVAVRVASGARYALTVTCAANVLGYAKPGMHAHGNPDVARLAFSALARHVGRSVEETARAVLDAASDKLVPVIETLIKGIRARSRSAPPDRRGWRCRRSRTLRIGAHGIAVRDIQGCRGHFPSGGPGAGARCGGAHHSASPAGRI